MQGPRPPFLPMSTSTSSNHGYQENRKRGKERTWRRRKLGLGYFEITRMSNQYLKKENQNGKVIGNMNG